MKAAATSLPDIAVCFTIRSSRDILPVSLRVFVRPDDEPAVVGKKRDLVSAHNF